MSVALEADRSLWAGVRVGSMLKVFNGERDVVAGATEITFDAASPGRHLLNADLLGELTPSANGEAPQFTRGVSVHPIPGEPVSIASDDVLRAAYGEPSASSVKVGTLYHDSEQPAFVTVDELLNKHFAILGSTGAGKSSALTVILSAIIESFPSGHVVLFDPHNEYSEAFKGLAEVVNVDNLHLPFWLLSLDEAARILVRGGSEHEQQSQRLILNDAILYARLAYEKLDRVRPSITVDTPVPYRMHDLVRSINEQMGRVTKADTAMPYLRLRTRIEQLRSDRRFSFLFSTEDDVLADIIGRLMRVPVDGKPLTVVDLSGLPAEIADVIVSTLCRVLFDFSVWCERELMPPLLLVCEEAQRYVPADLSLGFEQTVQVITQIAKEGRKYGVGLALITQRPSELAQSAVSQCGTIFALRLSNDADQRFVARALPDVAHELLAELPTLPTAQAIVSGVAVPMTMRIRFNYLPEERRPRSTSAQYARTWLYETADRSFIERGIGRWRIQARV